MPIHEHTYTQLTKDVNVIYINKLKRKTKTYLNWIKRISLFFVPFTDFQALFLPFFF